MDIQRYLASEPVLARPPSRGYRFRKLVRRNKIVFAAAGAVAAALIIGLGVSLRLYFLEREAFNARSSPSTGRLGTRQGNPIGGGWPRPGKKSRRQRSS